MDIKKMIENSLTKIENERSNKNKPVYNVICVCGHTFTVSWKHPLYKKAEQHSQYFLSALAVESCGKCKPVTEF